MVAYLWCYWYMWYQDAKKRCTTVHRVWAHSIKITRVMVTVSPSATVWLIELYCKMVRFWLSYSLNIYLFIYFFRNHLKIAFALKIFSHMSYVSCWNGILHFQPSFLQMLKVTRFFFMFFIPCLHNVQSQRMLLN